MVVTLNIKNYDVCHILIDNRSLIDVLFYDILSQKNVPQEWMEQLDTPLVEFIRDAVLVEGVITLPMMVGRYP